MFDQLAGAKYDVVYWNYPFHPITKASSQLTILEKAMMDPGYGMLRKYLSTASGYLKEGGYLLLGFSYTMGDVELLKDIASKNNWKCAEVARMQDCGGSMCLMKLARSILLIGLPKVELFKIYQGR